MEEAVQFTGDHRLVSMVGEEIILEGVVVHEPDVREQNTMLTVKVDTVEEQLIESTNVLLVTRRYPEFSYGDRISVEGTLQVPNDFETDAGRVFRYRRWLAKDDIFYQIFFPEVAFVSSGQGNVVREKLFALKQAFLANIERVVPSPEAALAGGLIVGSKQSLGSELQDAFRVTGVIHIVVLSGYNVTIIAEAIRWAFRALPLVANVSVSSLLIILFAILTGGSATIVRATIMGLLVMLARATGRTYAITRALFIAGFIMVLHNPKILVSDPSFQLSFLATLGLIHIAPKVETQLRFIPTTLGIREYASATIGTLLFVLPFLLYLIGEFSLVAVPANMLVLIAVPWAMLFGFLAGIAGFVSFALSHVIGFVAYGLLHYQLLMVEVFANIPFAAVTVPAFPFIVVIFMYCLFGYLLYKKRAAEKRRTS